MLKAIALAALLAAPSTAPSPPPKPCVPKAQIRDMVMVLSPYLVDSVAKKCGPALPATAFLNAGGPALIARLKAESAGREASAGAAMRVFGGDKMPTVQDTTALMTVMGQMMGSMATSKLPVAQCGAISDAIQALSPLPAENIGQLVTTLAVIGGIGNDRKFPGICPDG
jgi:hypothetical protein